MLLSHLLEPSEQISLKIAVLLEWGKGVQGVPLPTLPYSIDLQIAITPLLGVGSKAVLAPHS